MTRTTTVIETRDGRCPASIFTPEGAGPWPAVLMFMDGIGMRPAVLEVGERIAAHGYYTLVPDLSYRMGPYTAPDPAKLFSDPQVRADWFARAMANASQANAITDTAAYLAFLDAQPQVRGKQFGATGYCMGGGFALTAAGTYPDKFAAAAAFHPGRIATDAPDSPHLLAPKIKATVFVGGAMEDSSFPDDMKQRLIDAFVAAGVRHTVETFPARHGWVLRDTPVHDPAAAERHFTSLFALLDGALR